MNQETKTGWQVGNELLAIAGPEYIKPEVVLVGQDGNAFFILGSVWKAIRRKNGHISTFPQVEEKWKKATSMSDPELQSYDSLLQFCMTIAEVE